MMSLKGPNTPISEKQKRKLVQINSSNYGVATVQDKGNHFSLWKSIPNILHWLFSWGRFQHHP